MKILRTTLTKIDDTRLMHTFRIIEYILKTKCIRGIGKLIIIFWIYQRSIISSIINQYQVGITSHTTIRGNDSLPFCSTTGSNASCMCSVCLCLTINGMFQF